MSDTEQLQVQTALLAGEFVTDPTLLNEVIANLQTEETLDPANTMRILEASSTHFAVLSARDVGLLRAARLGEHTEADLSGFEQDYRRLFPDPEHRQILRFASLVQDSGKSLCVKATGDNRQQTLYNQVVTEALLDAVGPETMADDAKDAVRLLVGYDIIGNALQGRFDQAQLDELRAKWPARFANQLADFVTVSYMSDASAHTAHRNFTDMETGEQRPCVTSQDIARNETLDFLFVPPVASEPLALAQPYRRTVAALFPDAQITANLLADATPSEDVPTREYPYTTEADGIWSATLGVQGQPYEVVKWQVESFAMTTGFPISVFVKRGRGNIVNEITIIRDPSRRFGTLPPKAHERAVEQLHALFGWERQPQEPTRLHVSACIGLLEGYDEETGTLHKPAEVVASLLEHSQEISWRTEPTMLVSARRVLNDAKQYELQAWDEKVMRIRGAMRQPENGMQAASINPVLDQVKALAGSFNQRRFFVEDGFGNKTIAFAS